MLAFARGGPAVYPPPFRADHVGSLLRPRYSRSERERAIREAVAKPETSGLHGISDGEYSREWSHPDFLSQLGRVVEVSQEVWQ